MYTPQELQDCELTFPIIADASGEIFSLFGLVREDAIDPVKGMVAQVCTFRLPTASTLQNLVRVVVAPHHPYPVIVIFP